MDLTSHRSVAGPFEGVSRRLVGAPQAGRPGVLPDTVAPATPEAKLRVDILLISDR